MAYDPHLHHRRSIRKRSYDYSQAAPYFVTLCAQHYLCLFGDVVDGDMRLNEAGIMIQTWWDELAVKFPGTLADSFRIMPNHLHAVLVIVGNGLDMAAMFGIGIDDLNIDEAELNEGIVSPRKKQGGHTGLPPTTSVADRTRRSAPTSNAGYSDAMVQDNDHKCLYPRREASKLAAVSWQAVAT